MRTMKLKNGRRTFNDHKNSSWKSISKEFADSTSMHGLKFLSKDDTSLPERVLWAILFCIGLFFAMGFSWKLWENWKSSPVLTTIQSTNYPVNKYPFPTVTFCSVNKVSTRALARWMTSSQHASVLKVDDIRKILKILSTGRVDLETDLARLSQLMAKANITKGKRDYATLVKEISPKCSDMAIYCSWEDKEEDCGQLFQTEATDFGFCCSFNSIILSDDGSAQENETKLRKARNSGVYAGLSVYLNADIDDYNITAAPFTGFRVSIQEPDDFAQTGKIGFMVSPGHQIEAAVSGQTEIADDDLISISPDQRLCTTNQEIKLKYFPTYTSPYCMVDCLISHCLSQCSCVPFHFPVSGNLTVCDLSSYPCIENVSNYITVNTNTCNCPDTCNYVWYTTRISSGDGPNPVADRPEKLLDKLPQLRNMTKEDFEAYAQKNLAILNVFFDSLTGVCYIMDQRQTWADFISAAGGLLGLGFGFSILSAAELLYFFTVRWFYYYYRAKVNQQNTNRILAIYQHQQRTRRRMPALYNTRVLAERLVANNYEDFPTIGSGELKITY